MRRPSALHDQAHATVGLVLATLVSALLAFRAMQEGPPDVRFALLLIASPVLEELITRAGLQEFLLQQRSPHWLANLLAAAAFGLAHALTRGILLGVAVLVPALLLGIAYSRWRSVVVCIVLHAAMNAVWLSGLLFPAVHRWAPIAHLAD